MIITVPRTVDIVLAAFGREAISNVVGIFYLEAFCLVTTFLFYAMVGRAGKCHEEWHTLRNILSANKLAVFKQFVELNRVVAFYTRMQVVKEQI